MKSIDPPAGALILRDDGQVIAEEDLINKICVNQRINLRHLRDLRETP